MAERSNEFARVFCTLRVKHDPTALAESAWETSVLQEGIRALAALAVDKTDDVSRCTWVHGTVLRAVSQTEWHTPGTLGIVMNTGVSDSAVVWLLGPSASATISGLCTYDTLSALTNARNGPRTYIISCDRAEIILAYRQLRAVRDYYQSFDSAFSLLDALNQLTEAAGNLLSLGTPAEKPCSTTFRKPRSKKKIT